MNSSNYFIVLTLLIDPIFLKRKFWLPFCVAEIDGGISQLEHWITATSPILKEIKAENINTEAISY